jgi:cytochrome c
MNFIYPAFIAMMSTVGVATAQAPEALLERYKCDACHADKETKTGPAYADIAVKYRGNPHAVTIVGAVLRSGAHGGPWHMPPHPEVSDADATRMARYILSRNRKGIEKKD